MAPTEDAVKAVVIEWLGYMYSDEYPGNPDYRDEEDVDTLVAALMALMQGDA